VRRQKVTCVGALVALFALVATACGTTVPLREQRSLQTGGGLGSQTAPGVASSSGPGVSVALGSPGAAGTAAPGAASSPLGSGTEATSGSRVPGGGGPLPASSVTQSAGPDRSPLTVGLTYTSNSTTTAALGASTSNTVDQKSAAEALVAGINSAGGLDGRHLKTIEYSFNSDDQNYSTDAQAACTLFTQDNHVSVVLDTSFGTIGDFEGCLQKAGVVDITTQDEADNASSADAFLHANTAAMTTDQNYAAVLVGMTATGYLTRSNQMGVIVEDCPEDMAAYSKTLLPLIAHLGLKAPKEEQISCTTGFESAGPAASAIQNDILAFRMDGVDRVMFVSYNEAVILLLFANSASSQRYYPGYLLSSNAEAQALRSNIPADQWPQLHGVGDAPTIDVDAAPPSAVDNRCAQLVAAGGLRMNSYQDGDFVYTECGPFLLLGAALQRTNGNSSARAVMAAIDGLGTSFKAPDVVGSSTDFTSTRHGGPDMVQVFAYNPGCSCMRYTGSPQPAP
jgi:hypothetical protein